MTFSAYSGSGLKQAITHKPRFDFTDIVDGGNGELRHCVVPADVVRFIPVAMDLEIYTVQSARPARLIGRAGAHAEGGSSHIGEGYLDLNFTFTLMEK